MCGSFVLKMSCILSVRRDIPIFVWSFSLERRFVPDPSRAEGMNVGAVIYCPNPEFRDDPSRRQGQFGRRRRDQRQFRQAFAFGSLDFPKESGHEVKDYRDFSYSAGERYPSEE